MCDVFQVIIKNNFFLLCKYFAAISVASFVEDIWYPPLNDSLM